MKLEISKEELRNFLLHATDEQLAEMIEFIHPVDILEVIHEYKDEAAAFGNPGRNRR